MDMLTGDEITEASLTDWRKLGQGPHARYLVGDFGTGVRFVAAVGEVGDALGHHPRVTMGDGYVDLKLLSDDAVHRDDEDADWWSWLPGRDVVTLKPGRAPAGARRRRSSSSRRGYAAG